MIRQLIYTSNAIETLCDQDILDILDTSTFANERHDITGFLISNAGKFRQVIEGEASEIGQLYDNIVRDARHTVYVKNLDQMVPERSFPLWALGYCAPEAKSGSALVEKLNKYANVFDVSILEEVGECGKAVDLLKEFVRYRG